MKKLLFFTLVLFNISTGFAQNKASSASPQAKASSDTVSKIKKAPRITIVDGSPMSSASDIVDNISDAKEFSIFASALKAAGLVETFKSNGPITVFAPANSAFNNLSSGKLDTLLNSSHKIALVNLLTYHAVAGSLTSKDIDRQIKANKGEAILTTLAGGKLIARINDNRNIVLTDENGGQSVVSKFDVPQKNGMLHVITGLLVPKNKI